MKLPEAGQMVSMVFEYKIDPLDDDYFHTLTVIPREPHP